MKRTRNEKSQISKKHIHREPLTSDLIFKAVLGQDTKESKTVLMEMLNLILERKEDPIVDLTNLNPFSIAECKKEKVVIMDVKVKTSKEEFIDIEMQIRNLDEYVNRSIYYLCKQSTKGLERGEDYVSMKKSIVISFIGTTIFPSEVPAHSVYTLKERSCGKELSDILQIHYIELGKIDCEVKDIEELSPVERLGAYIKYVGKENKEELVEALIKKGEKVIAMIDNVLQKLSEDERLQELRYSREQAETVKKMEMTAARERGIKIGEARGKKQGIEIGQKQGIEIGQKQGIEIGEARGIEIVAKNMKELSLPMESILKATGLSAEEIERL